MEFTFEFSVPAKIMLFSQFSAHIPDLDSSNFLKIIIAVLLVYFTVRGTW